MEKVIDKGADLIDHGLDVVDHAQENAFDTIKEPLMYGAIGLCVVLGIAVVVKISLKNKNTASNSSEINLLFSTPLAQYDVDDPVQRRQRICEICASLLFFGGGGSLLCHIIIYGKQEYSLGNSMHNISDNAISSDIPDSQTDQNKPQTENRTNINKQFGIANLQ